MRMSIKVERALHNFYEIQHEAYTLSGEHIPNKWSAKLYKVMKVIEGKYCPYDTIKILSRCQHKDAVWSLMYLGEKYDDVAVFDIPESEVLGYIKEAIKLYKGYQKKAKK